MAKSIENLENAFDEMFDFITDLPSGLDGFESDFDSAFEELRELKATLTPPNEWVSVEEGLPDAEKEVRLFCVTTNGYKYQCQGFYVPPGMRRDDSGYSWDWECCDQYDEDSDDYFVNPGWYESSHSWDEYSAFGIADKVTHWMPLPAPPDRRPPKGEEYT